MNIKKTLIAIAVALPLVTTAGISLAQESNSNGRCSSDVFDKLSLSEQQKQQLNDLRESKRAAMKNEQGDTKSGAESEYRTQMQGLLSADNFDEQAAIALIEQMQSSRIQQQVERMSQQHQMLSVLTPEQKTQYFELNDGKCGKGKRGKGRSSDS